MRAAAISDVHVEQDKLEGPGGQLELLDVVAQQVREAAPEVILVGGDLAGTRVPHRASPKERNALVDWLVKLGQVAPVIVLRGNHDYPGDYTFINRLQGNAYYVDEPEVLELPDGSSLLCLPWLDRSQFQATEYREGVVARYAEAIEQVRGDGLSSCYVLVHAAMQGGTIRDGQPIVPIADPVIPAALFDPKVFKAVFVGHYHGHQRVPGPVPIWYPGSLWVSQHGEPVPKGWLLYDTEREPQERLVLLEQAPMVMVDVDANDGRVVRVAPDVLGPGIMPGLALDALAPPQRGAHVKVRVRGMDVDMGVAKGYADKVLVQLAAAPGCGVLRAEYELEHRARSRDGAVEVAAATTLADKVREFCQRLDPRPGNKVLDRALELLAEQERVIDGEAG